MKEERRNNLYSIAGFVLFGLAAALFACVPARAQGGLVAPAGVYAGSLTASGTSCVAANCVSAPLPASLVGTVTVQLAGTFVATVQFEGSVDGTHFVAVNAVPITGGAAVTSATGAGVWQVQAVGLAAVRARVSAYTSGTVTATLARAGQVATATTLSLPAALSVTSLTSSGAVSGTTGTFSGAVSGTTGTFSGAVAGTSGTFSAAVSGTQVKAAQTALTSSGNAVTFDAGAANSFKITLQENSALTVTNAAAGQIIDALVCQDGSGNWTWDWGAVIKGGTALPTTASKCLAQSFVCDGTNCWAAGAAATGL